MGIPIYENVSSWRVVPSDQKYSFIYAGNAVVGLFIAEESSLIMKMVDAMNPEFAGEIVIDGSWLAEEIDAECGKVCVFRNADYVGMTSHPMDAALIVGMAKQLQGNTSK